MKGNMRQTTKSLISKVVSYAKKQFPDGEADLLSKFIRLYYSHAYVGDLMDRPITDLYGAVLSHWELMRSRKPDEFTVHVFNPHYEQRGWQSTHTIIQVVVPDMPFIIDSIRMELDRMGITTHMMIHTGGLTVMRNGSGKIADLSAFQTESGKKENVESPIYFEIDRQTDPRILDEIKNNILRILDDVAAAVEDWSKMRERLGNLLSKMRNEKMPQAKEEVNEVVAFLEWLLEDHFTFLGSRLYKVVGEGEDRALKLIKGSGLGVLRDDSHSRTYRQFSELPDQARELMLSKEHILIVSKTNTHSTVHRPTYTDYIGVKQFNEKGDLIGETRFIGLYTSSAYNTSPKAIPVLRQKVATILELSGLPARSHGGKDLMHILATLPRDDLFHATIDELYNIATGILHLQERRRIRLFVREDAYGRFVSCLVYIPHDNFNADLLLRMKDILQIAFGGLEVTFETDFSSAVLARIHYLIRVDPTKKIKYDLKEIERKLIEVGRSWRDEFRESVLDYYGEEKGNEIFARYRDAFPAAYRELFIPRSATYDIERIENIDKKDILEMSFYRPLGAPKDTIRLKLFRADHTVPLSDALPMLENMGLRVVGEQPYEIITSEGRTFWINDFSMSYQKEPTYDIEEIKSIFQEAFNRIWAGDAENDAFNRLVIEAQLNWREIALIRAYTKYLRQTGFTFSQQYIAETFIHNPTIARVLIELFKCYFDPEIAAKSKESAAVLEQLILKQLDEVAILDEDRILRRCLDLIHATLRTNYFQKTENGKYRDYLSIKFDPTRIPDLPLPLPKYEIFVYSPRFEGVHLRAGKVARGGLRWSDRREDFRTEVLGLMKAQQVKNAVIVPSGAKGGFVPKNLPIEGSREEIMAEGIACYKGFINGLLDVTDNLEGDKVIPPIDVVCYDDPDPYLVVAADKGTATFSDIANSIAIEKNFWLGDAFASGGSKGYDHKKMAITARGAWVSAERHFQELGINVDQTEITVIGIGDMAGDVFGNGMLMSKHMKLVAAFNHMHIFLDPNPDPAASYEERKRLFDMPRSTWEDYNPKLISKGGGVFRRSVKAIRISPEIKTLLRIENDILVPNELLRAILKAPVDLIWNGGIGTFVKSSIEVNGDVGDRTNDAIRIDGNEVQSKVVCEGGNLGFTQLARIEYELNGGNINTDFIDNSGGVDCSDHEVNIKILLNKVVESGDLTVKQRNSLLARMTDEVASLVLQNNYHQNQAISQAAYLSPNHVNLYKRYLEVQEQDGKIDRDLEFLPDDKALMERKAAKLGLTRPEISVLFAYSKIILEDKIRKSDLPSDLFLQEAVKNAFPTPLRKRYADLMTKHRLSREIISTQISNRLVSDMGITFSYQMYDETGAPISAIVKAYTAVREIFGLAEIKAEIESLDYKVDATVQHRMVDEAVRLVRRATRWFLRNYRDKVDIQKVIDIFSSNVVELYNKLPKLLLGGDLERYEQARDELVELNVPVEIAEKIASATPMYHALNIIEAAKVYNVDINKVAEIYFMLVDRLDLFWFRDQINSYPVDNRWSALAKAAFKGDLDWIQRELTMGVLNLKVKGKGVDSSINHWFEKHQGLIARWENILADLRSTETNGFDVLFVAVRELSDLAQTSSQTK